MDLSKKLWWGYLEHDLQELLQESFYLLSEVSAVKRKFHDYSFIVFPAAKAYEGFLKKLFLDLGFIDEKQYFGKRFRIGKALNPELDPKRYKKIRIYDKLIEYCSGEELPKLLWETWRDSRNLVFHWFPKELRILSFEEAQKRVHSIIAAIDEVFKVCKIN